MGPCARIWVAMPRSRASPAGGILPRASCSCSMIQAPWRLAMVGTAIAVRVGRSGCGGGIGCGPGCPGRCQHVCLGLHHRRSDPAASTDIQKRLPCTAEAERSPDVLTVRKLLELSVVLQATPAHVGEGRYWYCPCSTFFCSALDVVCDSSYGVPAYAPGMDMMLDSLIIGYGYNSEIFELDHWRTAVVELSMDWDNLECVNWWNQVDLIGISLMDTSVHTQQRKMDGTTVEIMKLEHTQCPDVITGRTSQSHAQPVVSAAHGCECQIGNSLLSVNLWSQVNISDVDLLDNYVHTQQISFRGSNNLGFRNQRLQIDLSEDVSIDQQLIFRSTMASTVAIHERNFLLCFSCTCLSLSHDRHVEDAVSMLFGLCHRGWTTTPPLLIPRFNSGDTLSLSSVKVIRYLQLNYTPRVHIPDRLSGEPPAGHQLDRTFIEALEDHKCGNFESGLSTDERTPYGSICDLQHLLHQFRSSRCVQLGTYFSRSTVESLVMMHDP